MESDWREIRDLRAEMVRDTPIGFSETLEDALGNDEAEWILRAKRGTGEHSIAIAAITNSGRWIGTMSGFVPDAETGALLVGVYVTPDFRGSKTGVTDALLARIEKWARVESNQLTLYVHEDNFRARKAYERRGFVPTGEITAYILDTTKNEMDMVKEL